MCGREFHRRIYDGIKENGIRKRRMNREVMEVYKVPNVQSCDVVTTMTELILNGGPGVRKTRGRSRKIGMDAVREYLETLVRNWRKMAQDRQNRGES